MIRVGLGFDVHPFASDPTEYPDRRLVLGGVVVAGPPLVGHSDADVVCHAVADALLGPAGLGDLGSRYPSDDPTLAGVRSIGVLAEVAAEVARAGWWVRNVDVALAAERPRLAPHVAAMTARLTGALAAAAEPGTDVHVRIGPKRAEGLGFVGRAEGVACWAVALLEGAGPGPLAAR